MHPVQSPERATDPRSSAQVSLRVKRTEAECAGGIAISDLCLDGTDELLALARTLPGRLKNRRLAMESAAIVNIALRLSRHLRRRDPIAERVELSKPEYLWCCVKGAARHLV